jgi:hypothetical protein
MTPTVEGSVTEFMTVLFSNAGGSRRGTLRRFDPGEMRAETIGRQLTLETSVLDQYATVRPPFPLAEQMRRDQHDAPTLRFLLQKNLERLTPLGIEA